MLQNDQTAGRIDDAQPIAPQLHRILRERIIRNDLTAGRKLSEAGIARTYATSRQPVREAFIKLAEQGLLSIRPQRGSVVSAIDYDAVLDARFLREAIEADIVKLAAGAADPALAAALRALIERQRASAARASVEFIHLDDLFHRAIAEGAGKGRAWKLVEGLKAQMDRVRFLALAVFPVDKLLRQHVEIADAIGAGDPARAERAARAHLREILNDLPTIRRENPAVFGDAATPPPAPPTDARPTGGNPA